MKGNISLKDFILGVKKELQDASAEGSTNPFLELNQVELETEFVLETSGGVEGGFSFFVKATAETGASQSHKVKLVFTPIKHNTMITVSPSELADQSTANPTPDDVKSRYFKPLGPYYYQFEPMMDMDEIVKKAVGEVMANLKNKSSGVSGEDEG